MTKNDELVDNFFLLTGRDGAGLVEVQVRLQKALASLRRLDDTRLQAAARRHSSIALEHFRTALTIADIAMVEQATEQTA